MEAKLEEARRTIAEQASELEIAKESDCQMQQQLDESKAELDAVMLQVEVEKLQALEKVREEQHKRSQVWADDLQERFKAEKRMLVEKIPVLEVRSTLKTSTMVAMEIERTNRLRKRSNERVLSSITKGSSLPLLPVATRSQTRAVIQQCTCVAGTIIHWFVTI